MSTQIQRRRGTTAEHSTFTGVEGELTVDTTKDTVVVHDGATTGGRPLLREDQANLPTSVTNGISVPSANNVAISTNGTGRIYIDPNGKIGFNQSSPGSFTTGANNFVLSANDNVGMTIASLSSGLSNIYFADGTTGSEPYRGFVSYNHSTDYLQFGTSGTERLRLTSDGKLGLGTSNPGHKLEISTAVDDGIEIIETSSGNAKRVRILNSSTGTIYNATAGVGSGTHQFQIDGGEALRIDGSKRLLVGTSTDSVATAGVHVYNNTNGGRINNIKTGSGLYDSIANYHSGSYVGGLTYSNTATALVTSSDVRLKTNIQDSISAIGIVEQVRVVSHDWVNDDSSVRFGFVAQELNNVLPEAVRVGDDGDDIQQTWGVDYARLVPVLTKALQEAITRIETLEAKVQALKGA